MGPTAMGNGVSVAWELGYETYCCEEWGAGGTGNGILVPWGLCVMGPTIMETGELVARRFGGVGNGNSVA